MLEDGIQLHDVLPDDLNRQFTYLDDIMVTSISPVSEEHGQISRQKRAPYVTNACNECKRRKLKCDGKSPCHRCSTQSVSCDYHQHGRHRAKATVSARTRQNRRKRHSEQCTVNANANDIDPPISSETATGSPVVSSQPLLSGSRPHTSPQPAEFCGPSSSEFTFNVINGNLKAMGISGVIGGALNSLPENSSSTSSQSAQYGPFMKMLTMDPLWDLKRDDVFRLIRDYCYGPGSLYPVVDLEKMLKAASDVFRSLELAQGASLRDRWVSAAEAIFNDETNKLKVIIAIGRTLENGGRNDQAQRLFQSITQAVEGLIWNLDGINGIQLLVLVALYHYHLDEEVRTWRIVSFASRLCLEMGLHRREMLIRTFPKPEDQTLALKIFWSVYILERRTSLGQGIPFSLQDSHIDPSLFTIDISSPFLSIMIEWTKLAGKIWQALNGQSEIGSTISLDELDYLDYQIIQWYKKVPDELKLDQVGSDHRASTILDGQDPMYIPAILYVRKAHLRNLIYKSTLQSTSSIAKNRSYGLVAVQVAKESIQMLSDLNQTTNLVRTHALFFKHVLLTAFGNLLLAVVNATSDFWDDVRHEFHLALGLIKLLSKRSGPLMRLWHRLKGLEELQTKMLPSFSRQSVASQSHQSTDPTDSSNRSHELPPTLPALSEMSESGIWSEYSIPGPNMRDGFASLFNTSMDPDYFSDFPFVDFGE